MKNKIWKMLAAVGSFVVLASGQFGAKSYARIEYPESGYMVDDAEECRRLLTEIVSGTIGGNRQEFFITGKDYLPESLIIAQMFPEVINISNTIINDYVEHGHRYVTCRIGFERKQDEVYEEEEQIQSGLPIHRYWNIGDLCSWKIGEETYLFRCIDDDYKNKSDDQICALFLCETVIRSDIDSTESKREILTFGRTNNYKTSEIRKWLQEKAADQEEYLVSIDTGVNSAYLGATVPGTYSEFSTTGLLRHDLNQQLIEDEIFLLSLEEAIQYSEVIWEIDGGSTPYSHGYWLRTPSYSVNEGGEFCYGNWAYVVDLEQGCIRPAAVDDGSIGVRPAFCLPQG